MIQLDLFPHLKVKTGHLGFGDNCDSVCFVNVIIDFLDVT